MKKYAVVLLVALFFVAGYGAGFGNARASFSGMSSADAAFANFDPFWKVWGLLEQKYMPPEGTEDTTISVQDRVWGATKGLVRSYGDPYTVFLSPEETKQFSEEISGNFAGVGMEVGFNEDGALSVIAPLPDTPADKAGVRPGDLILAVDGKVTEGMSVNDAVSMIRGDIGTVVELTLYRTSRNQPFTVEIVRANITYPIITTEEIDRDTLLLRLSSFPITTNDLFVEELTKFRRAGYDNLILDLRGNPGGYLEAAVEVASHFLPQGKVVVREEARDEEEVFRSKGFTTLNRTPNIVILVDGGTASAAEILAGALSEHGVATLVGTETFGKGSVQQLIEITPETSLKVTIARWLTPNGVSLTNQGLTPEITIELPEDEDIDISDTANDPWIKEARKHF